MPLSKGGPPRACRAQQPFSARDTFSPKTVPSLEWSASDLPPATRDRTSGYGRSTASSRDPRPCLIPQTHYVTFSPGKAL